MGPVMNGAGQTPAGGRPVIGICARVAAVTWLNFDVTATLLPRMYTDLLASVGCTPVLLPLTPGIEQVVGRLDGLLLPGGGDVDPARYGAAAHPKTAGVDASTDEAEFALLAAALRTGVPFFGICRGLQVLNVLRGGTLHQYLPDLTGNASHEPRPGEFGSQQLKLRPGSHLAQIFGGETTEVPCFHHQAIDRLGTGLAATAWAQDGIIEAVEDAGHPFAVGVQWHADKIGDERPFLAFADAARQAAVTRTAGV